MLAQDARITIFFFHYICILRRFSSKISQPMKKLLLLFLLSVSFFPAFSQKEVVLNLNHMVANAPMALATPYLAPASYGFTITRLTYYISDIQLIHDGGQTTNLDSTWLLVHAPADQSFSLGTHNVTEIEGIYFSIGVDPAHNHLDPTTWPAGHPLAPQMPSMHWGWSPGYRFVALEGKTGATFLFTYEIHALGDDNYNAVSLSLDAQQAGNILNINLLADYQGMFTNLDVSSGLIEHGDKGPAITLLYNFANHVFSPMTASTAITAPDFAGEFAIGPNPSVDGNSVARYTLPAGNSYQMILTDITGREVRSWSLDAASSSQHLEAPAAGIWFIRLLENGRTVLTEKWISAE
jgi:hypothetical protein